MEHPKTTPKDFFMWAGAMVALYGSIIAFLSLIFDYINYTFPDAVSYLPADAYSNGVSYEMASFIILGPVAIILLRLIHRDIEHDHARAEVWVRRWALYLTLFLAGVVIVADLIVLLNTFLNGEIAIRFFLKVLVVLMVAAIGFMHFWADLKGYWTKNPELSWRVSWGVGVLGLLTIVAGFIIVGTPWQARLYRFDEQKVGNLQQIQSQILNYWRQTGRLPTTLNALNDSISNSTVPHDPQTGKEYSYQMQGARSFNLCATFNADSRGIPAPNYYASEPLPLGGFDKGLDGNWAHGAGQTCFLRTIDPELYPPNPKPVR